VRFKAKFLSVLLFLGILVLTTPIAAWAAFPEKPITIVVPYSAGGGTDLQARGLASVAEKYFGQAVVVTCKPGGGGAVGTAYVARSKPDGYTLLFAVPAVIVIQPYMVKTPYAFDDLEPLMRISDSPRILSSGHNKPWTNLDEFIEYAKNNPGQVSYGSAGSGTTTHIAMEGFAFKAGIKLNHLPFEGCAPAVAAIIGGHVDCFAGIPSECFQYIKSGDLWPVAVFSEERLSELPEVPTLKEKGIDFVESSMRGLFLPQGVPEDRKKILHDNFKKALNDPKLHEIYANLQEPVAYMAPDKFKALLSEQAKFYSQVLEGIGLRRH
jgi:tripartite-type tricarboxylate transporter receptor subunit TctC